MRWLSLPLLLFLASCCSAQDGISPDTLYNIQYGTYEIEIQEASPDSVYWCADTTSQPHDTSIYYGYCLVDGGQCERLISDSFTTSHLLAKSSYEQTLPSDPLIKGFACSRGGVLFDSRLPFSTTRKLDSLYIKFSVVSAALGDGDSLFVVKFQPRSGTSPYDLSYSNLDSICNFMKCSLNTFIAPSAPAFIPAYPIGGWKTLKIDNDFLNIGDTTGVGFVTRRSCTTSVADAPTDENFYVITYAEGDSMAVRLIYYHSLRYNDISHQDNADGISPDTLNFICSSALDSIRTPGYWRTEWIPDWNLDPGSEIIDCFHGRPRDDLYGCDSGYCASYWNRGTGGQAQITAMKRGGGFNDYKMCRAYLLGEIETPIPDTTEMDSMKLRINIGSAQMDDGDSLHIVTYHPRYSESGSDSCSICYGCWYPSFGLPTTGAWCNYWKCGDHLIWGEAPDRSLGKVPVYLGAFDYYHIHPSVVDFSSVSVGDTFGIGLVFRFEDSPAPTDTNECNILAGADCPYIVYWFSEPEPTAGFINWGLRPPHLGWGLPINQARKCYGGGRRP